eukprot:1189958-Prorocentrum_minimum.AAC.2
MGRRVHCWVLVMAGKREVAENYFVEPSTGRCYPCNGSPYEGVEFIWNHTNFWVNMQVNNSASHSLWSPPPAAATRI